MATGENHTVREFVDLAFRELDMALDWKGEGENEIGIEKSTGRTHVAVDPRYYRPTEVSLLLGDATKAEEKLGWTPTIGFGELVKIMVMADWKKVKRKGY